MRMSMQKREGKTIIGVYCENADSDTKYRVAKRVNTLMKLMDVMDQKLASNES